MFSYKFDNILVNLMYNNYTILFKIRNIVKYPNCNTL